MYVFATLMALLLLYPFLEDPVTHDPSWVLKLLNLTTVATIIWAVSFRRRQLIITMLLGVPMILLLWLRC